MQPFRTSASEEGREEVAHQLLFLGSVLLGVSLGRFSLVVAVVLAAADSFYTLASESLLWVLSSMASLE